MIPVENATSRSQGDVHIEHTNLTLEEELEASLVNGKLPCAAAFRIATRLKVPRRKVGDSANKLNIKIVNCQLGCFP